MIWNGHFERADFCGNEFEMTRVKIMSIPNWRQSVTKSGKKEIHYAFASLHVFLSFKAKVLCFRLRNTLITALGSTVLYALR